MFRPTIASAAALYGIVCNIGSTASAFRGPMDQTSSILASASKTTTTKKTTTTARSVQPHVLCFGDSLTAGTSSPGYETFPYARYLKAALKRGQDQDQNHQQQQQQQQQQQKQQEQQLSETVAQQAPPSINVYHIGHPGWTSDMLFDDANGEQGLRTIIRRIQSKQTEDINPFTIVIILVGTNDLAYIGEFNKRMNQERVAQSILSLHRLCFEENVDRTIVVAIPSSAYQSMYPAVSECARQINALLEEYCQEEERSTFVPFPFEYERGDDKWSADGLHFSEAGYRALGESIAPVVDRLLCNKNGR